MKLHSSESVNGSAPTIDPDEQNEDWAGEEQEYDYSNLFDAPSYSSFIKTAPNTRAKSYEARVASLMKAGMVMSLNNQAWPDASTFIKHGPGFAKAAGNLAAEDAKVAGFIDMITAPESPYVMFALVAIPLVSQLFRNHQPEVVAAGASWREARAQRKREKKAGTFRTPTPPITVPLFRGRRITIPIRVRVKLPNLKALFKGFLAPTQHPQQIAQEVFSDPLVVKALHNMGLVPREANRGSEG